MKPSRDDASTAHSSAGSAVPDRHQEALRRFIVFWGEMASNWGINRTMAQIHALLYVAEEPLDTDAIMERLDISRGNANMNLRSLIGWSLVRKVHQAGSRKDFYTAEKDVWEITAQIIKERERREIQPVVQQLQACRDLLLDAQAGHASCDDLAPEARQLCHRLDNLLELMRVFEGFSRALLPFVQQHNAPLIKQLIAMAQQLHPAETPPRDA